MDRININGQNSVATSAVTSVMASAFAAEMDSIFAKATSTKKNFPIMNFLCNVKVGTKKETKLGLKRNMLVTLLAPYGNTTIKGWVYQVDGKVSADSVVWLLESAIDYITKFENHLNDYKAGATNFTKKFIEVVEQYGVADLERRVAEMHQYFADLAGVEEQVEEQENEDIDYLVTIFNEKMVEDITKDFESTLQTIAEYGDPSGENEHVCGRFNYERYYEHEWVEFYNEHGNGGINHAYEIFRNAPSFTNVDFFNEDSACYLVYELGDTYGVELEDNACEDCLVWVKNPYYKAPKNDTPCLDIDIAVDRVVNTIKSYLEDYDGLMLDYDGDSACICIGWDNFSDEDMQMLIEDDVFEGLVVGELVGENISDVLVYDDGVYVTVDYDKTFDKSNVLNTLRREYALCDVDEYEMPINTLADRCGGYHVNAPIYVMYDKESDSYYVNGTSDDDSINDELTSKTTYMELYDMITETINVADTIANALDEAMESDDEYSDDIICQIGDWFVKYTSPCDKFPSGCVCVVNAKGINMGGTWCSVADFDTAVEYLVGMIEICNKEFNKVA